MPEGDVVENTLSASSHQSRYWTELVDLRAHSNYVAEYLRRVEFWDRALSIFSAIAGSGGIAAWAVWSEYPRVWSVVVAGSQVLTAIKVFLPYKRRLKSLAKLNAELNELCIYSENKWFDVSEGLLTDTDIHKLYIDLKNRINKSVAGAFGGYTLPLNEKFKLKANEETSSYISSRYGD